MSERESHFVHKIDHSKRERMVGMFILVASALLLIQLFVSSQVLDLFADTRSYTIELKNPIGVGADTKVKVSGLNVGWVESVDLTDRNTFVISLAVYEKFHALVRQDSRASISKLAVVGDSVINISPGDVNLPALVSGASILTEEGMTMDDILTRLQPVLEQTEAGVVRFSELLAALPTNALPDILNDLQSASENLKSLSGSLAQGSGSIGDLIVNKEFSESLQGTLRDSRQVALEGRGLIQETRSNVALLPEVIEKLDQLVTALSQSADQLPALLDDTDQLIDDSAEVVDSISETWPVSSFVDPDPNHEQAIEALPAN